MIRTRQSERGFAMLCVLMSAAIIGVLTTSYMGVTKPGAKSWAEQQTDRARTAVVAINMRSAETDFMLKNEGRMPDLPTLRRQLDDMSNRYGAGSGGRIFVDARNNLGITSNMKLKTWAERYELPRFR